MKIFNISSELVTILMLVYVSVGIVKSKFDLRVMIIKTAAFLIAIAVMIGMPFGLIALMLER